MPPADYKVTEMNGARFCSTVLLIVLTSGPVLAQDDIPTTSGFSGFVLAGPGYFNVESNLIVTGAPLLDDVGNAQIESIFAQPSSNSSPAFLVGGELNYTFSGTRTQLFFGTRLEDILRLDIAFGLGVRQELPDESILAASLLMTPLELKFWADPYIEGEDRTKTGLNFPGVRLRWGRILRTGLELTATVRRYRLDEEKSGNWLIGEGRLDPDEQPLLDREGHVLRLQALYRIDVKRHRFEPAVRFVRDDHNGAALANKGYSLQLTYLYRSPKVVLDANVIYGKRKADEVNPIYDETMDADRLGVALAAFIPVRLFKSSGWTVFVGGEIFGENTNIDFYDSRIGSINAGMIWRHRRP